MPTLLTAKKVVEAYKANLADRIEKLKKSGVNPSLKVILVGEHGPSVVYTKNKKKFCESVGAECEIIKLDEAISADNFLEQVNSIVTSDSVHGCLIQLPLPSQLAYIDVTELVPPHKDVDGFHRKNVMQLYKGVNEMKTLSPCTPKGIMEFLRQYQIDVAGKRVVVIGRSLIVGKPMALMLTNANATVIHCHSKTKNLASETKLADIIISAVGRPLFIKREHIGSNKPIVIDVGMNRHPETNKLCGDCDFENIKDLCSAITPVPGSVGPLTILMLTENLIHACERSQL